MIYTVRHTTRFRYSSPVTESVMEVRMQPRRDAAQHCLSFELLTDPTSRITVSRDYLGNIVHHFDILTPHSELTISAQALVTTSPAPPMATFGPEAWDALDALAEESDFVEMLIPSQFARPTPLLQEFAQELGIARRDDPLTVLQEIAAKLHDALRYTPQSTDVDSPIDVALSQREGVCQDYTHIMIALVRDLGIPCRYVSGYLYHQRDDASNAAPDATHAWVEALLPEVGWVGFDPTNNTPVGERHIKVAVGRDYADVPPTRGVFKGEADTELGVAVQVRPADEQGEDDELMLVMKPLSPPQHAGEQPEQQQQSALVDTDPPSVASVSEVAVLPDAYLVRVGCDVQYEVEQPTPIIFVVQAQDGDDQRVLAETHYVEPQVPIARLRDGYGNVVWRVVAPSGPFHFFYDALVQVPSSPDPIFPDMPPTPVDELPGELISYLWPTRYCPSDRMIGEAWRLFGDTQPGWPRVQAICDWIHANIEYGSGSTSATDAVQVYEAQRAVCRDFAHLGITFCRALNMPARYVCGYLPDINVVPIPTPMDFHAWFQVWLDGGWRNFDARHNEPRTGRIIIATGRDAVDGAWATAFGSAWLGQLTVWADEVEEGFALPPEPALSASEMEG